MQVAWLEQQADQLGAVLNAGQVELFGVGGFLKRYKLAYLIRIFCVAMQTRSGYAIKQVVANALQAMLPESWVRRYVRLLGAGILAVPSQQTISRMGFVVD